MALRQLHLGSLVSNNREISQYTAAVLTFDKILNSLVSFPSLWTNQATNYAVSVCTEAGKKLKISKF